MMKSVAIICAYFGALPGCYRTWLRSCECNPSIDFLLFTDQEIVSHFANFHPIRMTFEEMRSLVNERIGYKVALDYPYKLCDLKPMYGIFFEKYLEKYDYWGHCDMDLVFGDLRSFFEQYELEKYDKFLDLGHLSIYRNTSENNKRFMQKGSCCGSWKDVISDVCGHAFDERNGVYLIYKENGYPMFEKRIYADIATIYKRFRCALEDTNYDYQIFYWENGKTYRDYWMNGKRYTEEFIYIHFKKRRFAEPYFDVEKADAFYICPRGFVEKKETTTIERINELNPYKGARYEKKELQCFKLQELKTRVYRKMRWTINDK